jgi:hypothetical protein
MFQTHTQMTDFEALNDIIARLTSDQGSSTELHRLKPALAALGKTVFANPILAFLLPTTLSPPVTSCLQDHSIRGPVTGTAAPALATGLPCILDGITHHSVQIYEFNTENTVTLYPLSRPSGRPADCPQWTM